uniref:Putative HNH homing endonuclease n=1 Tax=viral metagenome TaxID=1070528 RepID=A0A6M3L512_9ZZZZ
MRYNETDLAYAAGIIDGEGNIGVYSNRNKAATFGLVYRMLVQVGMCEIGSVLFLKEIFGGSLTMQKPTSSSRRQRFHWCISTQQACIFLEAILPYLKIKQPQALLAMEFQERKKPRGGVPYKLTIQEFSIQKNYSDKLKALKKEDIRCP